MVAVSHGKKFIFLKTKKTAGTSIEMALQRFCTPSDDIVQHYSQEKISRYGIVAGRGRKNEGAYRYGLSGKYRWRSHMSASEVRCALGPRRWRRYYKISSIRNPFDRMISLFIWKNRRNINFKNFSEQKDAFSRFVTSTELTSDYQMVHIDDVLIADFFIRYENLLKDMSSLSVSIGLDLDLADLPHVKKMKRRRLSNSVSDFYNSETANLFLNSHDWVFKKFNYHLWPADNSMEI